MPHKVRKNTHKEKNSVRSTFFTVFLVKKKKSQEKV